MFLMTFSARQLCDCFPFLQVCIHSRAAPNSLPGLFVRAFYASVFTSTCLLCRVLVQAELVMANIYMKILDRVREVLRPEVSVSSCFIGSDCLHVKLANRGIRARCVCVYVYIEYKCTSTELAKRVPH